MLVSATTDLDYKLPPICKDLHCAKNGTEVVCTIPEALITSGMTTTNINFLSFLLLFHPCLFRMFYSFYIYFALGGGFSTYSSVPSWQAKQVKDYLNSNVTLPPRKYYNSTNRAYPDISALGHNFVIQWGGMAIQVDGFVTLSLHNLNTVRSSLSSDSNLLLSPLFSPSEPRARRQW